MPAPDPRVQTLRRYSRVLKSLALTAVAMAAVAVMLTMRGNAEHAPALIAVALAAGLLALLGTAAMTLFLSRSTTAQRKDQDQ